MTTTSSKVSAGFGRPKSQPLNLHQLSQTERQQLKVSLDQQVQTVRDQLHQARLAYNSIERQRNQALHNLNRLQRDFDQLSHYLKQHQLSDSTVDPYYDQTHQD